MKAMVTKQADKEVERQRQLARFAGSGQGGDNAGV